MILYFKRLHETAVGRGGLREEDGGKGRYSKHPGKGGGDLDQGGSSRGGER